MGQLAVIRTAPAKLCAFLQEDDRQLSMAIQEPAGVWGNLRISNVVATAGRGNLVRSTLSAGDNGTLPVIGMLLNTSAVMLVTNTGSGPGGPTFTQANTPCPTGMVPTLLALGTAGHMMVAKDGEDRTFAVVNGPGVNGASWKTVKLPALEKIRALAMATSGLSGAVPEAFAVTDNAVFRSTFGTPGGWSPFQRLGRSIQATGIAAALNGNNLADVIVLGKNGGVFHAHQKAQGTSTIFEDWAQLPTANQPSVGSTATNSSLTVARVIGAGTRLTVFVVGQNGVVHTAQQTAPDSNTWNSWLRLPAAPPSELLSAVAVFPGSVQSVDVLASSGHLFNSLQSSSGFAPWRQFPNHD